MPATFGSGEQIFSVADAGGQGPFTINVFTCRDSGPNKGSVLRSRRQHDDQLDTRMLYQFVCLSGG
jgi:hypothetical protein